MRLMLRATNYFAAIDDVGTIFFPFNQHTVDEAYEAAMEYAKTASAGEQRDANGEPIRPTRVVVWRRPPGSKWAHLREVGEACELRPGERWPT